MNVKKKKLPFVWNIALSSSRVKSVLHAIRNGVKVCIVCYQHETPIIFTRSRLSFFGANDKAWKVFLPTLRIGHRKLEKYSEKKNVFECYYIHYTTHLCESYVVLSHLHTLTRFYCPVKFHVPTYARQRKHSKGFRVLG